MHLVFFLFSRRVRGGDTDFLLIGIVFDATRFAAARVFSAPHVAKRVACLWLRCVDGVGIVFVKSLRLFQSFDKCVLREVGRCLRFLHGCGDSWSHASRGF